MRPREVEHLVTLLVGGGWNLESRQTLAFALGSAFLLGWCHELHFTEQETKV